MDALTAIADAGPADGTVGLAALSRHRQHENTADRVYSALSSAIRDNRLLPGQALSSNKLAQQLKVSRTPLREAMTRLTDAGLVQVTPQVGTRVSLIRVHDVEQARFVRESLEVAAFSAACELPKPDVSALREFIRRQQRAARAHDLDAFFAADEAMHERIFIVSGYPGAWQAVQRMKLQLDRLRRLSLPDPATLKGLMTEHTAIVDALESGDVTAGTATIRLHARRVLEQAPALRARYPDYFTDE